MSSKSRSAQLRASRRAVVAPQPPASTWARSDIVVLGLLILAALALYLWRVDQPPEYIYDEVYHAYTAARLAEGNPAPYDPFATIPEQGKPANAAYEWTHPALAKIIMQGGITLFGDTPLGWRFTGAVFGAFGISVFFVLARTMFNRKIGLTATMLLLLDGLWFVQSRTAMNDIFLVCFLLLAYLAFYHYLSHNDDSRSRYLWLTGAALGLAVATKWSGLYSFVLLALIAAGREGRLYFTRRDDAPVRAILTLAGAFMLVPATLYIGGYIQYFSMGYTWSQWRELQRQMLHYHTNLRACHDWASPGWSWPLMLRPVWYYGVSPQAGTVANVFALGNPVSWWPALPAIVLVGVHWRARSYQAISLGLILLGFLGQWLPWLLSPRVAYLYHMLPSVPFGCLAIAYALHQIQARRQLVWAYLALVLAGFVYFYPHYAAVPISHAAAEQHYLVRTWNPDAEWAYKCPSGTD